MSRTRPSRGGKAHGRGCWAPHERSPCPRRPWVGCWDPAGSYGRRTAAVRTPADTRADTSSFGTDLGSPAPTQGSRSDPGAEFLLWHQTQNKEPRRLLRGLQPPERRLWEECPRRIGAGARLCEAAVRGLGPAALFLGSSASASLETETDAQTVARGDSGFGGFLVSLCPGLGAPCHPVSNTLTHDRVRSVVTPSSCPPRLLLCKDGAAHGHLRAGTSS